MGSRRWCGEQSTVNGQRERGAHESQNSQRVDDLGDADRAPARRGVRHRGAGQSGPAKRRRDDARDVRALRGMRAGGERPYHSTREPSGGVRYRTIHSRRSRRQDRSNLAMRPLAIAILSQLLIGGAQAQSLTGKYVGRTESGAIVLTLRHEPNGTVTGSLLEDGVTTPLSGHAARGGSRLTAAMQVEGQQWTFSGELRGSTLTLSIRGETLTLTRTGAGDPGAPPPAAPTGARSLPSEASPAAAELAAPANRR